jgi:hypothetical protein
MEFQGYRSWDWVGVEEMDLDGLRRGDAEIGAESEALRMRIEEIPLGAIENILRAER